MVEEANNKVIGKKVNSLWLLDIFRGISALLIVLYHYTTQYDKSIGHIGNYNLVFPWGVSCGLCFFYVKWLSYSLYMQR